MVDNELDMLAITESWLTGDEQDKVILQDLVPRGFSMHQRPRKNRRGGGVAIIYRSSMKVKCIQSPTEYESFEHLECCIHGTVAIRLCVIYRPPGHYRGTKSFHDEFSDYASSAVASLGHLLLLGDFNLHMDSITVNREARDFCSVLEGFGLTQHIHKPTHKNGHTLDLVITRKHYGIVSAVEVKDCGFPDHFVIFLELQFAKPQLPKQTVAYRKLKSISTDSIQTAIRRSALSSHPSLHLDELAKLYNSELTSVLDSIAPLTVRTFPIRPDSSWYTEEICQAKQQRRRAEMQWRRSGLTINREIYIQHRNHVNKLIAEAKSNHYREKIEENKGDTKKLFQFVNSISGRGKTCARTMHQGDELERVANAFSSFFVNKIVRIRNEIPNSSLADSDVEYPQLKCLILLGNSNLSQWMTYGASF